MKVNSLLSCIVLASLAACAGPGVPYERTVCGKQVVYHPDNLTPCAHGASACTVQAGPAYDVYYSSIDPGIVDHENEHVCGMKHKEPWVPGGTITCISHGEVATCIQSCTIVTEAGNTGWKVGDIMCRIGTGAPVKVNNNHLRELLQ
jgi:hypothetical protein